MKDHQDLSLAGFFGSKAALCRTLVHMPRSLWTTFAADRLDQRELQRILQRHFPSGSQPGIREVVYPGETAYAIKLRFSKNDILLDIEAGPLLTAELEARLTNAIQDAQVNLGPRVFREVLFADHKLLGSWRYKDRFQITPVSLQAPQLNCLIGDHPFVLEIKKDCSKDGFITNMRTAQTMRNTELLLAGLVNDSVHVLMARSVYGYWVRLPGDEYRPAYRQPYYHCDGLESTDDFSPPSALAPVLPARELYEPYSMSAGTPFSIPDGLTEVVDIFYSLSGEVQERFLRSCYWLQRANRSFVESFSAAFMAVITAAEVLFEGRPIEVCDHCLQPRYQLRSSFAQLLETYVPLDECTSRTKNGKTFQARLKHLYDARSKITHGGNLRGWDAKSHAFTPLETQDDDDLRALLRVMPCALANWLRAQSVSV